MAVGGGVYCEKTNSLHQQARTHTALLCFTVATSATAGAAGGWWWGVLMESV